MAGFPTSLDIVNSRAGQIALALRTAFNDVVTFKAWLDSQTDANLITLGFVQADVTLLRTAFTDLSALGLVARAQATQPAANDFFFSAKKLLGIN